MTTNQVLVALIIFDAIFLVFIYFKIKKSDRNDY